MELSRGKQLPVMEVPLALQYLHPSTVAIFTIDATARMGRKINVLFKTCHSYAHIFHSMSKVMLISNSVYDINGNGVRIFDDLPKKEKSSFIMKNHSDLITGKGVDKAEAFYSAISIIIYKITKSHSSAGIPIMIFSLTDNDRRVPDMNLQGENAY